jgi:AcrR family transcriptional regulator
MPLREQKKQRTRQTILAATEALIRESGYHDTSMRDIASAADLSYQTVYNYFPTKGLILRALLTREVEAVSARIDLITNRYAGDLIATLHEINEARMAMVQQADPNRVLWREVTVDLFRQKDDAASLYGLIDSTSHAKLHTLFSTAIGMGHLDPTLDVGLLAHTVYCLSEFAFVAYIMDPTAVREVVMQTLNEQVRLLLTPYLI